MQLSNFIINAIGFTANITSIILWIPQALTTWKNRNNKESLKAISYTTQIIVSMNTLLWCFYGFLTHSFWLPFATAVVLPLSIFTIVIKLKSNK